MFSRTPHARARARTSSFIHERNGALACRFARLRFCAGGVSLVSGCERFFYVRRRQRCRPAASNREVGLPALPPRAPEHVGGPHCAFGGSGAQHNPDVRTLELSQRATWRVRLFGRREPHALCGARARPGHAAAAARWPVHLRRARFRRAAVVLAGHAGHCVGRGPAHKQLRVPRRRVGVVARAAAPCGPADGGQRRPRGNGADRE